PPESFERRDDVVAAELLLARELQCVRHGVEGLDGGGEGRRGVRVAVAVEHEVAELRELEDPELPTPGLVAVEGLLEVRLACSWRRRSHRRPLGSFQWCT